MPCSDGLSGCSTPKQCLGLSSPERVGWCQTLFSRWAGTPSTPKQHPGLSSPERVGCEAANPRRLVQMMEEHEIQAKLLVESVERDWEGLGEKTAAREQRFHEALEEENCYNGDGLYGVSPGLAMLNRMQKSGKTFAEVYADYVRVQSELSIKTSGLERMDQALTEVLSELEEKALTERDGFMAQIQEHRQKYLRAEKENNLQQQQLDDIGRRLKSLLKELARLQDPTIPLDEGMEGISPAENIDAVIANNLVNNLVLYRSLPQLQEQNQKLLKITRDFGCKDGG
ncbi:hypothetical protein DFH11DRAFT_1833053 [Phellopilus nigrolimitatus]|nr:hypothetical protein DFH11DRAFT_1833053 [Phellopilus nigrolimitatus]